jgi:ribosomal protein S18 acetylase RimI-like enzyme
MPAVKRFFQRIELSYYASEFFMSSKKTGSNPVIQNERRRLLIDATITAISTLGLANVTLAKIAKIADLTAGSVNFHFDNKETLLLETLSFLVEEFSQSIEQAMAAASGDPTKQLIAMFEASLDPDVTEPRKTAVWFAFSSEARTRDDYRRICGDEEKKNFAITLKLCDLIIHQGNKQGQMNARAMANAVQGLITEIWEDINQAGEDFDRDDARHVYLSFLASVFPWAYSMPANHNPSQSPLALKDKSLTIQRAGAADLAAVAKLFDLYRQFYEEPGDAKLARKFIGDNIKKERSVIFIARDSKGKALGFTQLYPGLCSVAGKPFLTLYDLYVDSDTRTRGVGRALMNEAKKYAKKSGASRIDLETAVDNYRAQALYEDLGYERDNAFYKYSLPLA